MRRKPAESLVILAEKNRIFKPEGCHWIFLVGSWRPRSNVFRLPVAARLGAHQFNR